MGVPRVASLQASLLQDLLSWMVDTADISPTHTDPRGMPSFPHAASSCAVSGDDGPYEASFEVLPAPNDLLAINGVDDFFEDGISSLEEFDALPAEELPASTDASLPCGGSGPLYKCAAAPIEQRADDLLSKLTLKQIIQQTWAPQGGTVAQLMKRIGDHGVGQLVYTFARAQRRRKRSPHSTRFKQRYSTPLVSLRASRMKRYTQHCQVGRSSQSS